MHAIMIILLVVMGIITLAPVIIHILAKISDRFSEVELKLEKFCYKVDKKFKETF